MNKWTASLVMSLVLAGFASAATNSANSIMVIAPFMSDGTWVFDDASRGLVKEPFIAGIPEMMDNLVTNIPDARSGFRLFFSTEPFPGTQAKLDWRRSEAKGNWYYCEQYKREGWLCASLFKYFPQAPQTIYVKAEPLPPDAKRSSGKSPNKRLVPIVGSAR